MFKPQSLPEPELFVPSCRLVRPATSPFYSKLDETLNSLSFPSQVRTLCAPAYSDTGRGRPGIDPVVYFKMLMVGFFEDIASERDIAERCQDSISLRAFLGYDLTQATPDHSSLSIIRQRLGVELYHQVFVLILKALQDHGLLKGRNIGIDTSVIQANASLRNLVNRNTQEAYWDYVRRLAGENGIDPNDTDAVRRFDRKRPKTLSNQEWVNPFEPDAKIGPTKTGATDMIYKPEHTVDLETGAIVQAEIRLGHEADAQDLGLHVMQAQENINQVRELPADRLTIQSTTADKAYHAVEEMKFLHGEGIRTVIADPVRNRTMENLTTEDAKVVRGAKRSCASQSGKELLRSRGMHLERSFAHVLDAGGARRTTLRGRKNLNKRYKISAAIYNLSQLMRKLFGIGTPKQLAARGIALFLVWERVFLSGKYLSRQSRRILRGAAASISWTSGFKSARTGQNIETTFFKTLCCVFQKRIISTGC